MSRGGIALRVSLQPSLLSKQSLPVSRMRPSSRFGPRLEGLATALPSPYEYGGAPQRGRQLAMQHPAAQCTRCHVIGNGESTVGPDLTDVGTPARRANQAIAARLRHGLTTRFHHMIAPVTNIAAGARPNTAQIALIV
jgi:hypothetical protein